MSAPARVAITRTTPWWVTTIAGWAPASTSANAASTRARNTSSSSPPGGAVSSPLLHAIALTGPAHVDLVRRVAFPLAARSVRAGRDAACTAAPSAAADDLGGLPGPPEVGAMDHRAAKARTAPASRRRLAACCSPERRERGVEPALPAVLEVPFGLAVADDQEVAHGWVVNQTARPGLTLYGARRQT